MSYTTYEIKENTPEGFRAVVVTQNEQGGGRVDFVTAEDERHVIGLADLAFLNRPGFAGVVCVQMLRSFLIFVQAFIESLLCFLGRDVADGTV